MSQRLLPLRIPVSLRSLLPAASFVGCADIRVSDAVESSQKCAPQTLFAAIPGTHVDGAAFVNEAIQPRCDKPVGPASAADGRRSAVRCPQRPHARMQSCARPWPDILRVTWR